ncbi:hypothetical protein [Saccharophagus degradans]|uniref:Uncharacterized protein n=1 Tax=Saccharophagus degradans TaxID=86304 RepID=A0AAW7X170_9GAMM|nr:hypothetical protein [Saccharophagus degradans]MDO6421368.1 hypothetical protein [Saccharophagus degradans]MDO6609565.1 hypothetical protein [Saccharophagus degradans]
MGADNYEVQMLRHIPQVAILGVVIYGCIAWVYYAVWPDGYLQAISTHTSQENALQTLKLVPKREVQESKIVFASRHPTAIASDTRDESIAALRNALFQEKRESIQQDTLGNYFVDISTPGFDNEEWLYSAWPLYVPDEYQLNEGVSGCASGGFYVPMQAKAAVVVITDTNIQAFHYVCSYQPALQQYLLVKAEPQQSIKAAISIIAQRYGLSVVQ